MNYLAFLLFIILLLNYQGNDKITRRVTYENDREVRKEVTLRQEEAQFREWQREVELCTYRGIHPPGKPEFIYFKEQPRIL
jgi:hypothetical protein